MVYNRTYDLQKYVNIMSYNIAEYDIGWLFNGLHDGETMTDLSETVFVRSNNWALKRTNTRTHTYTHTPTSQHTHTHTHKYTHIRSHSDECNW